MQPLTTGFVGRTTRKTVSFRRLKPKLKTGNADKQTLDVTISVCSSRKQNAMMIYVSLNSQLLSRVRKLLANSPWYFTCFSIKIRTRVIWWRVAFFRRASQRQKSGLKRRYVGKYPLYISYEFPLGRHFCFAKSLSTTMTAAVVSLRRGSHTAGDAVGVTDELQLYPRIITTVLTCDGFMHSSGHNIIHNVTKFQQLTC